MSDLNCLSLDELILEQLDRKRVIRNYLEEISNLTIADYFGDSTDELNALLSLPSSIKWRLTSGTNIAMLMLSFDMDNDLSAEENSYYTHKALDLIVTPVEKAGYDVPYFRFKIKPMMDYIDSCLGDNAIHAYHYNIQKKWPSVLNMSFNSAIKQLDKHKNLDSKYTWLDFMYSWILSDLYIYNEDENKRVSA